MNRIILLFFCFLSVNFAQDFLSKAEKRIHDKLNSVEVTLDFTETPFADVIRFIRLTSEINIVVDRRVTKRLEKEGTRVTLSVEELKLRTALDLLCQFYNLKAIFRSDVLFILDAERVTGRAFVKTYDIRNLCFPSRPISDNKQTQVVFRELPDTSERLKNIIVSVIEPNSWKDGNRIHINNGLLIVKNKARAHRKISSLLKRLGESHDAISMVVSLYIVDNYDMKRKYYSTRTLLHRCKISGVENTVSCLSTNKNNVNFSMALLPCVFQKKGIKIYSDVVFQYSTREYRDQGVALVVNGKESVLSVLPTPDEGKTLMICARVVSHSLKKEAQRPNEDVDSRKVEYQLHNERMTINFSEAPLFEVIDFLRTTTGINIIISPEAIEYNSLCEIAVKRLRVSSILELILAGSHKKNDVSSSGLTYRIENGVIIIVPQDKISKTMRSYYVGDLLNYREKLVVDKQEFFTKEIHKKILQLAKDAKDKETQQLYRNMIGEIHSVEEVDVKKELQNFITDKNASQGFVELYGGQLIVYGASGFHENVVNTIESLRKSFSGNVFIQCSFGKRYSMARAVQNKSFFSINTKFSDDTVALKIRPTIHGDHTWLEIEYKTPNVQGNVITKVKNGKDHVVADVGGQQLRVTVSISDLLHDYQQYLKTILKDAAQQFLKKKNRNTEYIFEVYKSMIEVFSHDESQEILHKQIIPVLISRLPQEKVSMQLRILQILQKQNDSSPQMVTMVKKLLDSAKPEVVSNVIPLLTHYGWDSDYTQEMVSLLLGLLQKDAQRKKAIKALQELLPSADESRWKKDAITTVMKYTNEWTAEQWFGTKYSSDSDSEDDVWDDEEYEDDDYEDEDDDDEDDKDDKDDKGDK
ncbi:hypothetical protein [Candidatus Uabimicrobium amorphum]|uniref:Secretin/TonB short N-terminal domain-containing protein n=1 Tax=Uabimicrobium amorphum TaxID=2596890 RepID=A0A5S9F3N0_UABAM|nr:hypothetical protein [Candidatus Uabimicrobium amorphum]BBM84668.1 hypothetical protein UABAM_03029 [Candidatus Uabimicrobium amorphum]